VNASTKKIGLFTSIQGETKKEGEEENKREKENKPINNHFSVDSKVWDVEVKNLTDTGHSTTTANPRPQQNKKD
jgi:predicted aspartyl protease